MEIFVKKLLDKGYINDKDFFVIVTEVDYKDDIPLPKGMFKFQPNFLLHIVESVVGRNSDVVLKVYKALESKNLYKFNALFYRSMDIFGYDIEVKGQEFSEDEAENLSLTRKKYTQILEKMNKYIERLKKKLTEYFFEFYKEESEEMILGEEYINYFFGDDEDDDDMEE
ncbi:hypothetical protein [Dictyoglomus thermophilum]|uniref:Uncharacterized protein n=3 Tax=Pseudomonadati TaxID=3379134 RepID=B5YAW6_DICT6|nr:hypothetical protein [Dictyoglomus thermophilum]ACI19698.1 hypothetical protein DICTH_0052 [Dictyoglomus thermophilum H-6-12]MCX7720895.1 hypothetical protein [Dictyoglomus thermophilum]TYT20951.1 hypothetical protein FY122_09175 [Dictyoglomus thermophilum]